jgi:hypothetical protein
MIVTKDGFWCRDHGPCTAVKTTHILRNTLGAMFGKIVFLSVFKVEPWRCTECSRWVHPILWREMFGLQTERGRVSQGEQHQQEGAT